MLLGACTECHSLALSDMYKFENLKLKLTKILIILKPFLVYLFSEKKIILYQSVHVSTLLKKATLYNFIYSYSNESIL